MNPEPVNSKTLSSDDVEYRNRAAALFERDERPLHSRLDGFPKYASRQSIELFLTRYEIFKRIQGVAGSIVECGVLYGDGILSWAKFCSVFEPYNHTRRIVGFDTFAGFPDISEADRATGERGHSMLQKGSFAGSSVESVREAVAVYDMNRALNKIPKVELVEGDISVTAGSYLADNPHLVVAMLYLDLDLYAPTREAIRAFLPRMPRGAVIVFDELNYEAFPGETQAVMEEIGVSNLRIERLPFSSRVTFATL